MKKINALALSTITAFALIGCGDGGSSSTASNTTPTTQTLTFIDDKVSGIKYVNGSASGFTDANGNFPYTSGIVSFYLGDIKLGEISSIPSDKNVFVQDILGVSRTNIMDVKVTKLASLLQSLDSDNSTDEIEIKEEDFNKFKNLNVTSIDENTDVQALLNSVNLNIIKVSDETAQRHLEGSLKYHNETIDTKAPLLTSSSISNGATNVSKDANIVLNFDEDIRKNTINSTNIVLSDSNSNVIECDLIRNLNVITINPKQDLSYATSYTLTLKSNIQDYGKNSLGTTDTIISFTTQAQPDTNAPTITSASTFSVNENQTTAFTITASDTSTINYSIEGTDANSFNINSSSGIVTFKSNPDFETKASYSLIVKATDTSNNTASQNVSVVILNVDETIPDSSVNKSGYLIDSAVQGIDYTCGTITGTTDIDGKFTYNTSKCPNGIEFKLGTLSLGTINPSNINTDTYLTIQELAGTTRNDITNTTVQKMAVLLQSLDDDNDPSNGIKIDNSIKNNFTLNGNISDKTDNEIYTEIKKPTINKNLIDGTSAITHLAEFTKMKDPTMQTTFKKSNTVIDMDTKLSSSNWLQWQDDNESNTRLFKNQDDLAYSEVQDYCSALSLDGLDDWRAPNREELLSIVDSSKTGAKIKSAFEYISPLLYATKEFDGCDAVKFIDFSNGLIAIRNGCEDNNGNDYKIRCVRGGNTTEKNPKQFKFIDNINAEFNTIYESNNVTISGLSTFTQTSISVSGGEYNIDDSGWTTDTGKIFNGQSVKVRGLSTSSIGIRQSVTLTIGGISDTFTVAKPLPKTGNIVTDPTTNLMWQDDVPAKTNSLDWSSAVNYCSNLTLDNYSDWRLPSISEAVTISDLSSANIKVGFENLQPYGYYWTTTSGSYGMIEAFYFSENYNTSIGSNGSYIRAVRCVRSGI